MKTLAALVTATLLVAAAPAQEHHHGASPAAAVLIRGLGPVRHRVSTRSAEAQRFFDQGLALVYAFNHEEAIASFKRAAELDPRCAMAWWGVALALGPNINLDVDPEREKAAYEAVTKAKSLAAGATPAERGYVDALARRYSADPNADLRALAVDYKNAMGALAKRFPRDLDLATLYAEAIMDLRPWRLWNADGSPAEGTPEIVATLEGVLRRDPNHVGANHYYVHAVEASPRPERALASAKRLETLAPASGHLVHMPAHIYQRTGRFADAAAANLAGIRADEALIARTGDKTVYAAMYYNHNWHFLAASRMMEGRYEDARVAGDRVAANLGQMVAEMPMLEGFAAMPIFVRARFGRWDDVLAYPEPGAGQRVLHAVWRYARGVALAARGDVAGAEREREGLAADAAAVPADMVFGIESAPSVLAVARAVLDARIAKAKGDTDGELALLEKAVAAEDAVGYDEPPDWYYPVRESLGAALLARGRAADAERVFRDDLARNPGNGRSLFGLRAALAAQGRAAEAKAVERQYDAAWRSADTKPDLAGY